MTTKRLKPSDREADILAAAMSVASRKGGYATLTRPAVANAAECSEGLVSRYFGTMTQLKRAVMRRAVADRNLSIVAQGLTMGDKNAQKAPDELKTAALQSLAPKG